MAKKITRKRLSTEAKMLKEFNALLKKDLKSERKIKKQSKQIKNKELQQLNKLFERELKADIRAERKEKKKKGYIKAKRATDRAAEFVKAKDSNWHTYQPLEYYAMRDYDWLIEEGFKVKAKFGNVEKAATRYQVEDFIERFKAEYYAQLKEVYGIEVSSAYLHFVFTYQPSSKKAFFRVDKIHWDEKDVFINTLDFFELVFGE